MINTRQFISFLSVPLIGSMTKHRTISPEAVPLSRLVATALKQRRRRGWSGLRRDNAVPRAAPKHRSIASSSPMIIRSRGMNERTDGRTDSGKRSSMHPINQASTYGRPQIDCPNDRLPPLPFSDPLHAGLPSKPAVPHRSPTSSHTTTASTAAGSMRVYVAKRH